MGQHRVRAGSCYVYKRNGWDRMFPQHCDAAESQVVRVVNLPMAPKANTMGQCHIEDARTGRFLGMADTSSLLESARDPLRGRVSGSTVSGVARSFPRRAKRSRR